MSPIIEKSGFFGGRHSAPEGQTAMHLEHYPAEETAARADVAADPAPPEQSAVIGDTFLPVVFGEVADVLDCALMRC